MRILRVLAAAIALSALPLSASNLSVVSPATATTLRGGSIAFVEWRADRLPDDAEEWEAFLSIDGGRYYGVRITPHLDIALHRFSFVVPNLDTADARIMIRTGDEVRETHFETPGRFAIVRNASIAFEPVRLLDTGRAEAAREGDPDVVEWAEGSRDGRHVTSRTAPTGPSLRLTRVETDTTDPSTIIVPEGGAVHVPTVAMMRHSTPAPRTVFTTSLARTIDLLLVCRRRNV